MHPALLVKYSRWRTWKGCPCTTQRYNAINWLFVQSPYTNHLPQWIVIDPRCCCLIFLRLTNLFLDNGVSGRRFLFWFFLSDGVVLGTDLQNDGRTLLLSVIYSAKIVAKVFPKLIHRCRNNWVAGVWAIKLFVSHIYQRCFSWTICM